MLSWKTANVGRLSGAVGLAIVLVSGVIGIAQRGGITTPVFVALLVGLGMVTISFFSSGAISRRQAKYGTNMVVSILLFGAILGFVNYLAHRYPQRIDLTRQGLYSLSDQTKKILSNLQEKVTAMVFAVPGRGDVELVQDILDTYARQSDKFEVKTIDPDADPVLPKLLKIQEYGTVAFVTGEELEQGKPKRSHLVTQSDYIDKDYTGTQMGRSPEYRFKGEQAFTTAILGVTQGSRQKIYFLAGHKELRLDTDLRAFKESLEAENYEIEELVLPKTYKVPDDAALVIIAGPQQPLLPGEVQVMVNYFKGGGKGLILPGPLGDPSLTELVSEFGLTIGDDVVVDPYSRSLFSPYITVASGAAYKVHEITEGFQAQNVMTIFKTARSLTVADKTDPWTVTSLVETTEAAWGEKTDTRRPRWDKDQEVGGSIPMAVVVQGPATDVPAEITVKAQSEEFGLDEVDLSGVPQAQEVPSSSDSQGPAHSAETKASPDAATDGSSEEDGANQDEDPAAEPAETKEADEPETMRWADETRVAVISTVGIVSGEDFMTTGNRDLILNTIGWLVEKKDLISIRSKDTQPPPLRLTEDQKNDVFQIAVVLLPALILAIGIVIWRRRR